MDIAGFIATALAAGAIGAIGAIGVGLGIRGARKVGSAYSSSVQQMREQQNVPDYYSQQPYYQYPQSSGHSYYPPGGYHHGRHSYGYHR